MKKTIFLILCILCSLGAMAQKKSITGVVTDASGESVIGASVVEVGTTNGVITDISGKFTLMVDPNGKIKVSYIGYQPQVLDVKGRNSFNIKLKEDSEMLDEVVVTGYGGKQLRTKVTNSISKVSEESLKVGVFSNPAQALSGAVSGLKVTQSSGNPGSTPTIVLRGGTEWDGSGSPLVMVDGQLRDGLNDINPEDIESMEVLKDAGATALYGARASNGVILITTKTGKAGKAEINLKAKVGMNYINNPYDFLGAKDFITAIRTAYDTTPWASKSSLDGASAYGTGNKYGSDLVWNLLVKDSENEFLLNKGWQQMQDPLNSSVTLLYKDIKPSDYNLNNPSLTQDYNVNMSGGNDKGTYYAGLGYNKSEGLPISSFYERYSFIFNGSYKLADWITASSNFNYNRANWRSMPGSQDNEGNYFGRIMSLPPTVRYEDEDGNPVLGPNHSDGNQSYQPEKWLVDNQTDKFTMIQSLEIRPMKNLVIKGTANWYYSEGVYESFTKDFETAPGKFNTTRSSSAKFERDFSQTYNVVLNYNNTFAQNHNIDVMLGSEYYDKKTKGFSASGSGAPTDDFADLNLTDNGEGKRTIDSWHSQYRILSYFGRLNYDYQGKYLLSGVFRYDGYSSLLGDNRWGFFPGVSAGWIFGKEDFIKNAVPDLSFGSYGMNGNATGIGAYTLQGSYNSQKYNGNVGYLIGSLPNPGLKWEKTRTTEVGLDLSFFDNRLNANFTYYNRLTMDKYADLSLPTTTGFSSVKNNNGDFRNSGVEMELSGTILKIKDWTWKMGGNISYNKNKVVTLPDNGQPKNRIGGQQIYTGRKVLDEAGNQVDEVIFVGGKQEGQEPGILVGYKAEGLYKDWKDIPGDLVVKTGNYQGKYQYGPKAYAALSDAEKAKALQIEPGDVKWKDINNDGTIDAFDQIVIGNTTPHWFGGFNTTLTWKGLTLYGRFDFALDYWIYDNTTPWFLGCMQGGYNTTTDVFNTWSEENPNAKYPRYVWADQLGTANYYRTSTMFAYKGNYLAIREISLSYSLPQNIARKFYCQKLDVSVTGQNLGYITSANVATPEVSSAGSGYALPRTLLFGINVTF